MSPPKKLTAVRNAASDASISNMNVPVAPTAIPGLGLPPPRKLPPSAAPASNVPNGAALSSSTPTNGWLGAGVLMSSASASLSLEAMLNRKPVMNPPLPGSLVLVSITVSTPIELMLS
jgi:hypothetical protein